MPKEKVKEKEVTYKVLRNFTVKGRTRGYVEGETFPRENDLIGKDTLSKLLGKNANNIVYIEEQ